MHRYFVVGLLQVLCSTLGSEVIEHRLNSGLEGSNNATGHVHLNTLEQFLNDLESRVGTVESDMSTVKATQARSRCLTGRKKVGASNQIDDRNDNWKTMDHTINFSPAFRHTPKIILSVTYADIYKPETGDVEENLMSNYEALDITKSSFRLHTQLRSEKKKSGAKWYFYDIYVSWMAC